MSGIVPQLGSVGVYSLKEPFNSLLTPQVAYTCRSLRMMSDVASAGEPVWEQFYEPLGVSIEAYEEDLRNNACIVGLQAGTGEWIYVPSSHILKIPDINGVLYSSVLLGVNLGPIPDSMQLDGLISQIQDLVEATIGLKPEVKGVLISQPAVMPLEDSKRLEDIRAAAITNSESNHAKIVRLQNELSKAGAKVTELENWIKLRL